MKVSVLIPVYNKAPYLKDCLDSVFNGTWTDLEVLAVDDASTDDSLAVFLVVVVTTSVDVYGCFYGAPVEETTTNVVNGDCSDVGVWL